MLSERAPHVSRPTPALALKCRSDVSDDTPGRRARCFHRYRLQCGKMSAHCPVGPDDWRTRRRKLSDHGAFARAKHPCKTAYYAVPIRSTKPGPARTLLCPDRQEKWND